MTNCTSLAGEATATNSYDYVKLSFCLGCCERLTNNNFQSLKTKVLINVSFIDCNLAGTSGTRYTLAIDFFLLPVP